MWQLHCESVGTSCRGSMNTRAQAALLGCRLFTAQSRTENGCGGVSGWVGRRVGGAMWMLANPSHLAPLVLQVGCCHGGSGAVRKRRAPADSKV